MCVPHGVLAYGHRAGLADTERLGWGQQIAGAVPGAPPCAGNRGQRPVYPGKSELIRPKKVRAARAIMRHELTRIGNDSRKGRYLRTATRRKGTDGWPSQGAAEGCGSFESSRTGNIPAGRRPALRKQGKPLAGAEGLCSRPASRTGRRSGADGHRARQAKDDQRYTNKNQSKVLAYGHQARTGPGKPAPPNCFTGGFSGW